MIVVDGRTDKEKLFELLNAGGECDELDFKETLDLSNKLDALDFIKDAVSMCNRYPGGYIIVGADNDGRPSAISEETDWKKFDGANLTDKIRGYVSAPLTAISQLHKVDGHTYCLICLRSPENGLPVPFSKLGQALDGKGRQKIVFREGEFSRRDGAQNRYIEYSQWPEILKQHDVRVRKDESKRMDSLVDKIIAVLGEKGKTPLLVYGMDEEALGDALVACFEQKENEKLIRFVNQCAAEFLDGDGSLDTLVSVGTHAVSYSNDDIFGKVADALYDCYLTIANGEPGHAAKSLELAVAAYEIGAQLVGSKRWELIAPFVNRQSPDACYIYASWIRDCQVTAARAGLFNDKGSGMMISIALENACRHPFVAPDCKLEADEVSGDAKEAYLDLLCSFDFLYCLCVYVAGVGSGLAYPACISYSEKRIAGVVSQILGSNEKLRRALLPDDDDASIARGLRSLYKRAGQEASRGRSEYFWGFDPTRVLSRFLDKHPSQAGEKEPDFFGFNNADRRKCG